MTAQTHIVNPYAFIGTLRNIQPSSVTIDIAQYKSLQAKAEKLNNIVNPEILHERKPLKNVDVFGIVMQAASSYYAAAIDDIMGRTRRRETLKVRQVIMYLCRCFGMSLSNIGRRMNKDHTTAMHSVKVVRVFMKQDEQLFDDVSTLYQNIESVIKQNTLA